MIAPFLRLLLFFVCATATWGKPLAPTTPPLAFPQEESDLQPDPAVKFGRLSNGLRYVIRPNHEPKERASLRLLVLAGSLHERDDQRGLAHFLEHMAFNGSADYPPGTLVEFFQRMGMSFGGDTNANTSFDCTVYMLELPHSDEATLTEGLRVFSNYAGSLLLTPEKIDRERGVILAERRASDSIGYRTFLARLEAMLGPTRFPQRVPIGTKEVIEAAPRARFSDFWNTWYRPERMAVVVVGDFADPAAVEKLITDAFARQTARAPTRPDPSLGKLPKFNGIRPIYHAEPEAPATTILLTTLAQYARERDTAERQRQRLPRQLGLAMLNRRLSILAKKESAPFTFGSASVTEYFDFYRDATISITCKPQRWHAALALGEQELRRALKHGFTETELREAAATHANQLDQAVKTASTRRSNQLADGLVRSLLANEVFTTPADDFALLKPALEKIAPANCLAALQRDFGGKGRFVMVSGNVAIANNATAAIRRAYEKSRTVAVAPATAEQTTEFAYTDFGPPGEIEKREHIDDLGIELITFKNGVRLNLKKTDFEAGRIAASARIGNGGITEPRDRRGLAALASGTFIAGGLGKHSADDLRQLLAGKNVGWRFAAESDTFRFSSSTTPDDLLLDLQLIAAQLTDPGYRPEALRVARNGIQQLYRSFEHTANGPLATDIASLLASGDPRFGMPPEPEMLARNLGEVKTWLTPQLKHGALEVALVGDLDVDAAIDDAAHTIGTLLPREPKPELAELKKVAFPEAPFTREYSIDSEIPKAALLVYWPTDDALDVHRSRRLNLLAAILNDRLRVQLREELGTTYSPRAGSNASDTFPGYGYFTAIVDTAPGDAPKISERVINIADELVQNGVTADELERARLPLLTALRESARTNGYWISNVLSRAQEKPEVLDWARTRIADIESISTEELSALAQKYLGRARASHATILPKSGDRPAPVTRGGASLRLGSARF